MCRHLSAALISAFVVVSASCAPNQDSEEPTAAARSKEALSSTGLPGWSVGRRYIVDHTGPGAVSLAEFQVRLTLDTAAEIAAGRMKADCSDLRVYDGSGCTPVNAVSFWVADGTCNTTATHVWLKLPSIPAQSLTPLAFFWGNPAAASVSNGPATFPAFFDDFNGGSLDTTKWHTYGALFQGGGVVSNGGGAAAMWSRAEVMQAGQTVFGVRTDAQSAGGADIEYGAGTLLAQGGPGDIHFSSRIWSGVTWMSYDHKFALIGANPARGSCVAQQMPDRWANIPGDLTFFQSEFFYELNADSSSTFGIYDKFGQKLETRQGGPGCTVAPRERAYWQWDHADALPNPISRVDYAYVRSYAKPDPIVVNTGIVIGPSTCLAAGEGPCTPSNAGTVCTTARCGAVSNVCVPNRTDACAVDGDCAGGQLCVSAEFVCETPARITSSVAAQDLVVGTAWSSTVTASGTAPLTLSASGRPAWLSFDAASGVLSGTPTADGTFTLTLGASNRTGSDSKSLVLTVRTRPAITNGLVAYAEVGRAFSASLSATGTAPISFTATNLPPGLSLSAGVISGTPTASGRFDVQQTAQNAAGADVKNFVMHVRGVIPAPVVMVPAEGAQLGDGQVTFSGAAPAGEAGHLVRVREDGAVVCEATVQGDGSWTCQAARGEGAHQVFARVVSAGGLEGAAADAQAFVVDLTKPAAPSWQSPQADVHLGSATPLLSGLGEPAAQLVVRHAGQPVCSTVVGSDGRWQCVPGAALGEGARVLEASQRDAAGNVSDAVSRSVVIDTVAPVVPVLNAPAADAALSSKQPLFSGSAEASSLVIVLVDGAELCRATADAQGAFSCSGAELGEGAHQVSVQSVDLAGNVGTLPSRAFSVDTIAPASPSLGAPAANAALATARPAFSGEAEASSVVVVKVDGATHCLTVADAQGAWTCSGVALADGPHQVGVQSFDAALNVGTLAARSFSIDTIAPVAPTLGAPAEGSFAATSRPAFSGTAEADSEIVVKLDGVAHCRTAADAQGRWSCVGPALRDGAFQVSVSSLDAALNESTLTGRAFTVDTVAPVAPSLDTPVDGLVLGTKQPLFSGSAEAHSTVVVRVDGLEVCRTTATHQQSWSCTSPELADGAHAVTVESLDAALNASTLGGRSFVVDTQAPAAPAFSNPGVGVTFSSPQPAFAGLAEAGSTVTVRVDGDVYCSVGAGSLGAWTCSGSSLAEGPHEVAAVATDEAGNVSPPAARPFAVDTVQPVTPTLLTPGQSPAQPSAQPVFSGTAEAGSELIVLIGGVEYCRAHADAQGAWSCSGAVLPEGAHEVTVASVDVAGNMSSIPTQPFSIDTVAPVAPSLASPAEGAFVASASPVFLGSAEPGSAVVVTVDGEEACRVTAGVDGAWQCSGAALDEGPHQVSVSSSDGAGNSTQLPARSFTVDTVAPAAPVIVSPTGRITEGSPTVTGTAEPGSHLLVTLDGRILCRVTADAQGQWSCAVTSVLAAGFHEVATGAVDAAGNASRGVIGRFDVQTARGEMADPPKAVEGERFELSGKATPGATVNVYVDGVLVGSTTAGSDGSWSYELPALDAGAHEVSFGVTGSDGSEVFRSPVQKVDVAATVPAMDPAMGPAENAGCGGCSGVPGGGLGLFGLLGLVMLSRRRVR